MRLVTYSDGTGPRVGVLTGDGVAATGATGMLQVIRSGELPHITSAPQPVADLRLLAPLPRPGKLLFCGVNYASHKRENPSATLPAEPFFFAKLPSAVIGPGEPIRIPSPHSQVDYEVELAVVIGKGGRGLRRGEAAEHVFGYTVVNDVSGRDVQFKDNQITLGKGFDTFAPMGPCIVTAGEISDPQALRVASYVNGEQRQGEATANMLFPVAVVLEFVSRYITLDPGDIVSTGTPAGVGLFRSPPSLLAPGDVVEVEVDAIGRLRNPVVAGW
ncbi:MAG: fumarylacetoacetate hydrolase family protein [Micromonosporaceae bacterium]